MKYLINFIELSLLIVFWLKLKGMKDENKIDIAQESKLIIFFWGFFSLADLILQIVTNHTEDISHDAEYAIAIVATSFILIRNALTASIAYYFSIHKV